MMDTFYRGLAAPQRTFALGQLGMAESERPGAILAGLVNDALLAGSFEPRPRPAQPAAAPTSWAPVYAGRSDYGAFDDAFDDESSESAPGH